MLSQSVVTLLNECKRILQYVSSKLEPNSSVNSYLDCNPATFEFETVWVQNQLGVTVLR